MKAKNLFYLLEHAFDMSLEAGEIPHTLIFIEMVFQATAQHDYKRAVTLVNAMAHAPFQVSERQWTDLFEKNGDTITQDGLEKLLDALHNCDVGSEATVLNLSRSLLRLCQSYRSRGLSSSPLSAVEPQKHHPWMVIMRKFMICPQHSKY
ncbi:hypothetical protein Pyn_34523 [Prunus yedoensis var. nudiflora]|uniref:Pentatricopeptide repeat-containing protein n=1 Tax=Prunus yedoensis var. nudiflora TaxID=2094558 RepID=A0A315A0M9_PRUYE|nr:hypothetical protein Pyn_34523 [Prunus yedoensis var. nudiflora]